MAIIEKWDRWANGIHSYVIDAIRLVLGVFIFYKGLFFLQNTDILVNILHPLDQSFNSFWLVHYVAMAHLAGGVFISVGLLTRLAVVIQIPILLGAVIFYFIGDSTAVDIVQPLVALTLLFFFTLYGSGKFSVDHLLGIGIHD